MPYIDVRTNITLPREKTECLKSRIARSLAESFPGKTENWLMLDFRGDEDMYFAGTPAPCAMVDICIFGPQTRKNYEKMTAAVTELIADECGIPADRIYVKYTEYDKWGWNGGNF